MKLVSFRVFDFRSISDSGEINVSQITSIIGRNESGKSNLLLALKSLNPKSGYAPLNKIKDFPRHRRLEECVPTTKVLSTVWEVNETERSELAAILRRAHGVQKIIIERYYSAPRKIVFDNLPPISFDEKEISTSVRKIVPVIKGMAESLEEEAKNKLTQAADNFEQGISFQSPADPKVWSESAKKALSALRQAIAASTLRLGEPEEAIVTALEDKAEEFVSEEGLIAKANQWAIGKLPIFIYLDDYPELKGHQNISEYLKRKATNELTIADVYFEKLCAVAGLNPTELNQLLERKDQETRNQLANRASAVVTTELKRLWKDRALKVRFNLDAEFMDTLVSDPNATFDVEVNLDERSRGFKWFFSFYITFSADTKGGDARNAILLLDEPGLYLHAKSQYDLLNHFVIDFQNQIIYTTHSPFMVPTNRLDSIRTVNIDERGTTVSNDPSGDSRTLFPLQAALGYDLVQSLFVGPNNLVIEGVTDFWIISSISDYISENGGEGLKKELTLTPAGGAPKISYMVTLLTSENLNVLVLLDAEKDSKTIKEELVKSKLIPDQNIAFVNEAFVATPPSEADIEDLLEPNIYIDLVRESYVTELTGKTLTLNPNIPRIAKRVEAALADIGITFYKTRPARLLLKKMAQEPEKIVDANTKERFITLFKAINKRFEKQQLKLSGF